MTSPFTLHDFTHEQKLRGQKLQNQKQGHISLFRSLLGAEWSKDPIKLSLWIRLLAEATFKPRTVKFKDKDWHLQAGELVTTSTILGSRIYSPKGSPLDKRAVLRILKFFERENMIKMQSNPFALIIYIVNYCDYQEIERGTPPGTPDGTPGSKPHGTPKASNGAGLKVVAGTPHGTPSGAPDGIPASTQNNTENNTDLKKISSSRQLETRSKPGSRSTHRPDSAVESLKGKFWGTSEDLRLAKWIYDQVLKINSTAQEPNWAQWANDIRLMRQALKCDHRRIAEVFRFANSDGFWQSNVLSPSKLRLQWETLSTRIQQRNALPDQRQIRSELDFDNSDWAEGLEI